MRTILIDNDASLRETLRMILEMYAPEIEILGEADGVKSGLVCIKKHQPELILLDIEMNDGTGFDLLSLCGESNFKTIFVTGHDAYAIRAFKYSAIDYILKPVEPDDLMRALDKAKQKTNHQFEESMKVNALLQNHTNPNQKLVLSDSENVYLIAVKDIIRCQSEANYTRFYLADQREILVSKTLKEYVQLLAGTSFFRAHQSHLINLNYFDRFEKKDGGIVHMKDGSTLPVAVRRRDSLLEALKAQ
ncbi:MAG: LytR/AlgR family response regulator transcription factor [Flammeovirgaceae bacterium]